MILHNLLGKKYKHSKKDRSNKLCDELILAELTFQISFTDTSKDLLAVFVFMVLENQ